MPASAPALLRDALKKGIAAAAFTSSSSVTHLAEAAEKAGIAFPLTGVAAISIGPITSKTLRDLGWEPVRGSQSLRRSRPHPSCRPSPPLTPLIVGCPIQARLGGIAQTTNPHLYLRSAQKWVPHPSFAWVGQHKPQPSTSNPPQNWVPHPSSAWVGQHKPQIRICVSAQHKTGCPIQASLGWDSTNLNPPRPTHPKTGCPIQASLGWDSTNLNPPRPTHPKTGCPIQALLGWDSTNLNPPRPTHPKMGAPSKLRLGGIAQTSTLHVQPTPKLGAPSKLRLGGIAQTSTLHVQPTPKHGCPIQASLGWDSTNLNPPRPTHPKTGCPIQASLGWDSTTSPSRQLSSSWGAPSKLRLGGKHKPQPSTSNPPQNWVPHPSFAWVGEVALPLARQLANSLTC